MPKVMLPLAEAYMSIERPVAMQVAKRLIASNMFAVDGVTISFPGKAESQPLFDSRTQQENSIDGAHFSQYSRLGIEATEEYFEYDYLTMATYQQENRKVFHDKALDIAITPIYSHTEVTLSFTYRCKTMREAMAFRDAYRVRYAMGADEMMVSAEYTVPYPKEFIVILQKLYGYREQVAGYGDTWGEWVNRHLHKDTTYLTTLAGGQPLMVIKEKQDSIVGWFEFDQAPVAERGEVGSTWMMSFDFKFRYRKPIQMLLEYPQVIHNQLLPWALIGDNTDASYDKLVNEKPDSQHRHDSILDIQLARKQLLTGVRIPYFDEFVLPKADKYYENVITALVQVTEDKPRTLVNLMDFEPYKLSEELMEYIRRNYYYIHVPMMCAFVVNVFCNGEKLDPVNYYVSKDFDVCLRKNASLRKTYRVQIEMLLDPTKLNVKRQDALRREFTFCKEYLATLPVVSEPRPELKVVGDRYITRKSFSDYLRVLQCTDPLIRSGRGQTLHGLVGYFIVTTH